MEVDIRIICNDALGVLAAGKYADPRTEIGVVLGTGTNAACVVINIFLYLILHLSFVFVYIGNCREYQKMGSWFADRFEDCSEH